MKLDRSRPYGVCAYATGLEGPAYVQNGVGFDAAGNEWGVKPEAVEVSSSFARMWPIKKAFEARFGKEAWNALPKAGRLDAAEKMLGGADVAS